MGVKVLYLFTVISGIIFVITGIITVWIGTNNIYYKYIAYPCIVFMAIFLILWFIFIFVEIL